ncbi:hypothetical protein N24_2303 [Corynebacterium suranareeae]|uniref:C4-type zinc ribbon domain-containing protein n=1 Tax=Corynebacterium suranareeae TaxID=2506452 RepID=A0A160PSE1_9CORY|nr:zinc ribbon domain-containing protein [Corynebacterium suranareeae]BAU96565.1 hypothetical protein N24_2303 [Corynebacterium suranareeae]
MKLDHTLHKTLLQLANAVRTQDANAVPKTTPEQEAVEKAVAELSRNRDAASAAQMAVDDMENEILRIQSDERKLRRRKKDSQDALGAETDEDRRRDLNHDVYTAKSRIADLMSELQEAHNEIHALRNNRDLAQSRVKDTERKVEEARAAVEQAQSAAPTVEDPAVVIARLEEQLPADVVAEFQAQRLENGVGAALFNGRSCGGCAMVLPASGISEIRNTPKDEVPQCPECGSYLITDIS